MEQRGLTQTKLADTLDVRESTVSTWMTQGSLPNGQLMAQLPGALGVSGHWLLTGQGHMLNGIVDGDPRRYAEALRKGALMTLNRFRDMLNEVERQWNQVSEDDLVAALVGKPAPEEATPPWNR